MSNPTGITTRPPVGGTLALGRSKQKQRDKTRAEALSIKVPFDWCLAKGQRLRKLQKDLHEAEQTAGVRLRMCANLQREILRKEAR